MFSLKSRRHHAKLLLLFNRAGNSPRQHLHHDNSTREQTPAQQFMLRSYSEYVRTCSHSHSLSLSLAMLIGSRCMCLCVGADCSASSATRCCCCHSRCCCCWPIDALVGGAAAAQSQSACYI